METNVCGMKVPICVDVNYVIVVGDSIITERGLGISLTDLTLS
jgi:hypothetical protein